MVIIATNSNELTKQANVIFCLKKINCSKYENRVDMLCCFLAIKFAIKKEDSVCMDILYISI